MRFKRLIPVVVAAAAVAVPAAAMAAPGGTTTCTDNSLAGKPITTNVTVPAGATCDLSWADVQTGNNVTVYGKLVTYGITHFGKNVTVMPGGSFAAANWGVTIDGNLSITDPAANSGNGFWGDQGGTSSLVRGNLSYTITPTAAAAYPQYQWPYLYLGGPTAVKGNVTYSVGALSSIRSFDQGSANVSGSINVS